MNVVDGMAMARRDAGDRRGAFVPDAEPDDEASSESSEGDASTALEGLAGCVAAVIENFRSGSFAAGFLPPEGLPPARAIESDAVHWDLTRLEVAPDRRDAVVGPRPGGGPGAITVRPTRVHGTVAIRSRRDGGA